MSLREPLLKGSNGVSIEEVEELLRRHADFEKTVDAQEPRVNNLCKDKVSSSCHICVLCVEDVLLCIHCNI